MEGSSPLALCVVCGISVPQSSSRRTLYPPIVANEKGRGFFLKFVADASNFQDVPRPAYACKPCFAKLERGSRQYSATVSLISEAASRHY